jgi:hypothetical protein
MNDPEAPYVLVPARMLEKLGPGVANRGPIHR